MLGLIAAANQDPRLARVFSTFARQHAVALSSTSTATRRRRWACGISDIFTALQATLGGFYVNDFNLFGRTWQVNIQAEAADRDDLPDIWRIHVRNARGEMVPLRAIADVPHRARPADHQPLQQLPLRLDRRARRRPGVSSGDGAGGDGGDLAPRAAARLRLRMDRHRLPGKAGGGADRLILALAVLFAYLFLVALYESWIDPGPGAAVGRGRRARRLRWRS